MGDTKLVRAKGNSLSLADLQRDRLRGLEDDLLESSLAVVGGTCDFAELDPEDFNTIPQAWIDELGEERAAKKHRMAKAGWLPAKEAPIAISTATKIVTGIVRARATEKSGPRSLNINMVKMTAPMPDFEVVDVGDDDIE
jgi:hypothetical protein